MRPHFRPESPPPGEDQAHDGHGVPNTSGIFHPALCSETLSEDLGIQLNPGRKICKKNRESQAIECVEPVWIPKWDYIPTSNRGIRSGEAHWRGERFVGDFTSARMLSVAPEDNRAYTSVEDTGKITCFRLSSLRKAAISDSLR